MVTRVLYDACVLYPAPLRDLLMHLAVTRVFKATWTDRIHEEWIRNLLQNRPDLTRKQLERVKLLMNSHVDDAVITGYEHLIPSVDLPDDNDRHVLAASIHGSVQKIITFNLKDFPDTALRPYHIQAQHPDVFVTGLLRDYQDEVLLAMRRQHQSLRRPAKTMDEFLDILFAQGLEQTVSSLRRLEL